MNHIYPIGLALAQVCVSGAMFYKNRYVRSINRIKTLFFGTIDAEKRLV